MLESPYCDDSDPDNCTKNCCANTVIAPLYFISFCLVSTFVMLNLVIAVLMAELENAENDPDLQGPADEETKVESLDFKNDADETKVDFTPDVDSKPPPPSDVEESIDTLER